MASLAAQMVKNPPAMPETWARSLGWEDPLEVGMRDNPLQYSYLENPHGQRSLAGHKESDMTKQLTLSHFHMAAKTWYSPINKYF